MADVTEVIKRLIVEAQTRGLDKAAADFEKFGATAKQAAATTENSLASTGKSFERLAGSIDPARKQLQLLAKDLATLESGRGRAGVSDEYINGLKEARIASANLAIEAAKTNAAIGAQANGFAKMGPAVGLARHEMVNFGRQVQDIGVSLASGQSPFMVLVQQGTQVADIFATSQTSVKGFAAQVGSAALRFGPWIAAIGAVGTALYAVNKAMDEHAEAMRALGGGRGRFLGATPEDITAAARRGAGGGMSAGEAREGILEGVRAGGPSLAIIEQANAIAKQYAMTLQMDLLPAQKELMAAFADPAKGAETLEQKLKFLDGSTKDYIKTLQANGETAKAAQVLMDALRNSVALGTAPVSAAESAWAGFKTTLSQVVDMLGQVALAAPRAVTAVNQIGSGPLGGGARRGSTGAQGRLIREQMGAESAPTITAPDPSVLAGLAAEEQALRQVYNALEPLRQLKAETAKTIATLNTAFANEVAVMNAVTVEQRALATQQQVMNDLSEKNVNATLAAAQAELAAQRIREQAAATSRQRVADQQIEIEINSRMISAYQQQTDGIESVVARLKEEQSIRQAGMDATSKENQARIENAGRIAEQTKALEKLKSAQQGAMATTYNPNAAGGYEMAGGGGTGSDATSQYNSFLASLQKGGNTVRNFLDSLDSKRFIALDNQANRLGMSLEDAARYVMKFGNNLDQAANSVATIGDWASTSFAAGGDKPMSQRGGFTSDLRSTPVWDAVSLDRQFGKGNWTGAGVPDLAKIKEAESAALKQKSDIASQTLQSAIGFATRALSKQIQQIQEAASDQLETLRDAAQEAGDALSEAGNKREKLETALKENEDKRQQRIQNYLAAGPSPFEKNADIFYDPKSRMAFAEQIAGNTDELLVAQLAAAKAQEAAAKDADKNAKAAVEAGEATQKAAEQQVKQLQAQQEQLELQAELISAGLDIDSGISNNVLSLIGVIKSELPASIADHMSALMGITAAKSQIQATEINKTIPAVTAGWQNITGGATQAVGGVAALGGGGVSAAGYGVGGTSLGIRRYARGGEFTVPGSYSAGDRPFVLGLAGQERVTVETPAQQAARRGGGGSGTQIENLIVQMPPATNPIEYMNKRSRPALSRAVRGMARGMH